MPPSSHTKPSAPDARAARAVTFEPDVDRHSSSTLGWAIGLGVFIALFLVSEGETNPPVYLALAVGIPFFMNLVMGRRGNVNNFNTIEISDSEITVVSGWGRNSMRWADVVSHRWGRAGYAYACTLRSKTGRVRFNDLGYDVDTFLHIRELVDGHVEHGGPPPEDRPPSRNV